MAVTFGDAILYLRADDSKLGSQLAATDTQARSWVSSLGSGLALGIGAALAAVVAGIGAAGVGALKLGQTFDEAYDNIIIKTGATGSELAGLKEAFRNVFSSVPTEAGPASEAIVFLNNRLGLTDAALESTAANLLEMTRLLGGDASTNAELFTRLVGDWSVANEDAAATLDKVFLAAQESGASVEDLMSQVVQFGSPLRLMGFSLEESIGLFAKWAAEGVNSELVMGSLRIAAGKFADEGKPLRESLLATFEAIKTNEDATAALALGMDVFGARAGPDMVAAIREGRFELGDFAEALGMAEGAIAGAAEATADFPEKLQIFKNRLMTTLEPIGAAALDLANKFIDKLLPAVEGFLPALGYLADLFTDSEDVIGGLANVIYYLAQALGFSEDEAAGLFNAVIGLREPFEALVAWLGAAIPAAIETLVGFWNGTLMPALLAAWDWIQAELMPLLSELAGIVLAGVKDSAEQLAAAWRDQLLPDIQAAWAWIQAELFPLLASLWDWLKVALPIAIQTLVDFWNNTLLPALIGFSNWYRDTLGPLLADLWAWLKETIPAALAVLADFWTNTLSPAIAAVAAWVTGTLFPTLSDLWVWLNETLTAALETLAGFWENTLKPAIERVWQWMSETLFPFIDSLVNLLDATFGLAIDNLSWSWENVLKPALETVWQFLKDDLMPVFESLLAWWADKLQPGIDTLSTKFGDLAAGALTVIKGAIEGISSAVEGLTGFFNTLADAIRNLPSPPPLFKPGSPTPFEVGLRGIADAMSEINSLAPTLKVNALPTPALAGAAGGGAGEAGTVNYVTNLTAQYAYQPERRLRDETRLLSLGRQRSRL